MAKTVFLTQGNALDVVTLAEAKQQLRIPADINDEDAIHTAYILAAVEHIEQASGRLLRPCTVEIYLDSADGEIRLPWSPLAVTAVALKNDAGTYVATTDFDFSGTGQTPIIKFNQKPNGEGYDVVRITATAGFAVGQCPQSFKQAVKLLVVHYDENRSETTVPVPARSIPKGIDALINPLRNTYFV